MASAGTELSLTLIVSRRILVPYLALAPDLGVGSVCKKGAIGG